MTVTRVPVRVARVADGTAAYWPIGGPHFLVVGTTGAGKSSVVRCVACAAAPSPLVQLVGIDLKAVELSFVEDRLSAFATEPEEAAQVLADLRLLVRLRKVLARRRRWQTWEASPTEPFVAVIVDELAEVITDDSAERDLVHLLRLGRALGVTVLAATQRAEASLVGGAQGRMLFAWRMAMASLDEASYELGLSVDAAALRPLISRLSVDVPGVGLLLRPGQPVRRARAVWWPDATVDRTVAQSRDLAVPLPVLLARAALEVGPAATPLLAQRRRRQGSYV